MSYLILTSDKVHAISVSSKQWGESELRLKAISLRSQSEFRILMNVCLTLDPLFCLLYWKPIEKYVSEVLCVSHGQCGHCCTRWFGPTELFIAFDFMSRLDIRPTVVRELFFLFLEHHRKWLLFLIMYNNMYNNLTVIPDIDWLICC